MGDNKRLNTKAWKNCPVCGGKGQVDVEDMARVNPASGIGRFVPGQCPTCAEYLVSMRSQWETGYEQGKLQGTKNAMVIVQRSEGDLRHLIKIGQTVPAVDALMLLGEYLSRDESLLDETPWTSVVGRVVQEATDGQ